MDMHIEKLIEIAARLRGPDGCPWDREQTRESLRPFLVEELYELVDAIDEDDPEKIREELGDMLFQIVLHCQISKEEGLFDIDDVAGDVVHKMIGRHPHVFAGKELKTSEDVHIWWNEQKKKEGKKRESVLDRVPRTLPALTRAKMLQEKASAVGFDWKKFEDVTKKLDEEVEEFKSAFESKNHDEIEDELGDIFFVLVRIANFVKVDPETALKKTIEKFICRFSQLEKESSKQGRKLSDMSLEEMEILWDRAKKADT